MVREVDLMSYLPLFMQGYREPAATLRAEEPEFDIVWAAADRMLRNRSISTADEYGIGRLERILGIYPQEGASHWNCAGCGSRTDGAARFPIR